VSQPTRSPRVSPQTRSHPIAVPSAYLSLYEYLNNRFADTVVLTFAQIEDLLGFALPDLARIGKEWWANEDTDGTASQSCSWTEARRTATPNLLARSVVFERSAS
jgi:hypothetical protein